MTLTLAFLMIVSETIGKIERLNKKQERPGQKTKCSVSSRKFNCYKEVALLCLSKANNVAIGMEIINLALQ